VRHTVVSTPVAILTISSILGRVSDAVK